MRSRHHIFVLLALFAVQASASVKTGVYRGDGSAGRSILVGFQPAVVLVKGNDSDVNDDLTSAVMRTDTMAGDASKPLKGDQPLQPNLIQSLDATGFTVGADRKVNAAGIDYYWVAFESTADLATGTFVGNGTLQSLSGLGFSPDYVVVLGETARRAVQRPASAPDSYQFWAGSAHVDAVTSLDADGFSVAASSFANEAAVTYHYVAWNAVEGETVVGAYVGSGTDDRSITTAGVDPTYLIVRTSSNTQDPFQRMRAHSGDAAVDFRGTVQANRIQSFETSGFQVGTDTRVNTSGDTYFYVAFGGCAICSDLSVAETVSTIGVTTDTQYAMTFDEAAGGGLRELYDLREDPGASVDLAGGTTGVTTLFDDGIESGGVWYNVDNDTGGDAQLLEATSARAIVRQLARHVDDSGGALPGPLTSVDYGVYTAGRVAVDWTRWIQTPSAVPYTRNDRDLNVHLQAAAPLDTWSAFSQSGALGTGPGSDDFLLAQIDRTPAAGPGARMDILHIQNPDWASANLTGTTSFPADEWLNLYWSDTSGGSFAAGSRTRWSGLTYLDPNFTGPQDSQVLERSSDYRAPAVPTLTVGNGWFDVSENTSAGDFFNEAEATYDFTFDPLNGLDFSLDGDVTPRFSPFFKVRGWRSLSSTPTVTLIGTELAWTATDPTGDLTPADDTTSADETHRVILRAPFITRNGNEVRIKLRAHSTQPVTIHDVHIAEIDPADERDVIDGTWTALTFGGSSSASVSAGGTLWSDWVGFAVDEAKSYSVTFHIDPLLPGTAEWFGPTTHKYLLSGDQSALVDWSAATPSPSDRIDALEELDVRESVSLTKGGDYRADLKPISRAYFAQDVSWYTTAEDGAAVTSPDAGAAGTVVGAVSYVAGRYGGGIALDADGEYLTVPASQVFDPNTGAVELWYRPSYDFGTGPLSDDDGIFGYWIDNTHYFYVFHEPYAGGSGDNDGLNFDVRAGSSTSDATTGAGPGYPVWWRAGEWVHLRLTWDLASGLLETYINGTLAASGAYLAAPTLPPDDLLYVGERNRFGTQNNHARGTLDEITFYSGSAVPSPLAHGGLASDANEFLVTSGKNAQLAFGGVDALKRGEYLFLGADSKFSGLNVDLAVKGAGVSPGALEWEYWSNASGWQSLEVAGFVDETESLVRPGTVYWPDPGGWDPYSVSGGPDLYMLRVHLATGEAYSTPPTESVVKTDVLLFQYCQTLTRIEQRFLFNVPPPTAVALVDFRAIPGDGRVSLEWETASEVQNLGFHLYRSPSATGPYERITDVLVPGLGSSPEGAAYRYVDTGVTNGFEVFYLLEDIESTGRRRRHGPISTVPSADAKTRGAEGGEEDFHSLITYGDPAGNRLTVTELSSTGATVELRVGGFYAEPLEDGTVRVLLPGLETSDDDAGLAFARAWVSAGTDRNVELDRVLTGRVDVLSLRPATTGGVDTVALYDGTVGLRTRAGTPPRESRGAWRPATLASVAYQGDEQKALVELHPLYWDDRSSELRVARRIVGRLSFESRGRRESRHPRRRATDVTVRLSVTDSGIHRVPFEDLRPFSTKRYATSDMRLSRLGYPLAFHVEPETGVFGPGSTLYFVADHARANPYGKERVYELSLGANGVEMDHSEGVLSGQPVGRYRYEMVRKENRLYQAALVQADDVWHWDALFSGMRRGYELDVLDLAREEIPSRLELRLQGGSDSPSPADHHVRAYLNGAFVGETFWDGKIPEHWETGLPVGLLHEGRNLLELENVGDTGAAYSMVYLDEFRLTFDRHARARDGELDGVWSTPGIAVVENAASSAVVLEIAGGAPPRWVARKEVSPDGSLRFLAEAGRRYLVASEDAIGTATVRPAVPEDILGRAAS